MPDEEPNRRPTRTKLPEWPEVATSPSLPPSVLADETAEDGQKDGAAGRDHRHDRLKQLFDETTAEMSTTAAGLMKEASNRMKRYKLTRLLVALTMCLSVVAVLLTNFNNSGFDFFLTRISPIVMTGALFFYVIEAFLRDYEVSLESGREAVRLSAAVQQAQFEWAVHDADDDASSAASVLRELFESHAKVENLIIAERVPTFQEMAAMLQAGRKTKTNT